MKLPKSKYKGVYPCISSGKYLLWQATKMTKGVKKVKSFPSERGAAIFYDKLLIEEGKDPVNILKPKHK